MSYSTRFNNEGRAIMVDVSNKLNTKREAIAKGSVYMNNETLQKIKDGDVKKGDVLSVSQVAGIMAAKRTGQLVPMCHNVNINAANIEFYLDDKNNKIDITAIISTTGKTGAGMEALTAVSVTALTIYDMCKSLDKTMKISDIRMIKKTGGKSGDYLYEG
ncbi:cyclic pyranopterin monophosphate synthase MoaC [Serpentinicella alkaliphila]|uniref:Cyclic pyranopterin monophosphate synthase n=1 Tax=Serpentinicella alkaliphila TaxID=1734049 RepID=A0A4R2TG60_9FIRM|nr:cyclic pyranopterin monophosphate synthase MoaC [Serpentinicella alkaliphila]QUH26008.1 cyclic pyranopterin monophosphate synthase MoaC [Serpentinicella alkaliphila]TCQ02131.1 cyclic pyranopterin monophosphate synthase subunit MoaC [Serpentinicella alkaliphila]